MKSGENRTENGNPPEIEQKKAIKPKNVLKNTERKTPERTILHKPWEEKNVAWRILEFFM